MMTAENGGLRSKREMANTTLIDTHTIQFEDGLQTKQLMYLACWPIQRKLTQGINSIQILSILPRPQFRSLGVSMMDMTGYREPFSHPTREPGIP